METTIKRRIIRCVFGVVVALVLGMGVISIVINTFSSNNILKSVLSATALVSSERVEWEITYLKTLASELGCEAMLSDSALTDDEKMAVINNRVEANGLVRGNYIHTDGNAYNGNNYSDREYFQEAMKGNTWVSEPVISKTTGELSIIVAAPVWKDGIAGGTVDAVIYIVPKESFLNDIVVSLQMSRRASAYILDKDGNVIAHEDIGNVLEKKNTIEESKTRSSLKKMASVEKKMIAGESGYSVCWSGIMRKSVAYAPIPNTNGWSIAICAPVTDFSNATELGIGVVIICILISMVISGRIGRKLGDAVGEPVKECARRLELLAQGDLTTPVPTVEIKDETYILASATKTIVTSIMVMIQDMSAMLEKMAGGNFDVDSSAEESYVGDFNKLFVSITTINRSLSDTLRNIQESSVPVSVGSEQMSQAAQNLAEGATDQAGAVDHLAATIADICVEVNNRVTETVDTSENARAIGRIAQESASHMQEMTEAMERISQASNEIVTIVQEIEEIAAQTNLLSLNASIEAARAGDAGKGFSVVALEVGQLAKQSSSAVEHTRKMVQTALSEIDNGHDIVKKTISDFKDIIKGIQKIVERIETVAVSAKEEREMIGQLNQTVSQISEVIQSNSATAEQTSATSEELSAQALVLKELIAGFKIR